MKTKFYCFGDSFKNLGDKKLKKDINGCAVQALVLNTLKTEFSGLSVQKANIFVLEKVHIDISCKK